MFKDNPKLKNIFLLGFLFSFHLAVISYFNSSFLSSFSSEKNVSLIYISSSVLSLILLFLTPLILKRVGEYKFLLLISGLSALSLLLLALLEIPALIILIFIFYFAINYLIFFALDELLEIFSRNSSTGRIRGFYLTLVNLAWVISQIFSGRILSGSSFATLYFLAFVVMLVFLLVAFLGFRNIQDPKYDKSFGWHSFKSFFANKNLARAYKINFLLQFFYAWMVIYTPIYLFAHLNFTWEEIGTIFMIMLLPFVLIQFPLGKYSDKIGERKILIFGFLIAAISTLTLFFIRGHEVWIWATALFCTRIGAAAIEVMSDVYFFRHISKENDEFISVYRNTAPFAYIVAPIIAFAVFYFVPSFNYIFLVLGALMFYGVYLSYAIKKNDI
ncbi:MAG: MFS transporter [Candidatus Paceibacterota bacterium]|jgi:MFS family permease